MKLHSEGQKDFIKELKAQRDKEIHDVKNSSESKPNKASIIETIKAKFTKLIKDSDDSLFVAKL